MLFRYPSPTCYSVGRPGGPVAPPGLMGTRPMTLAEAAGGSASPPKPDKGPLPLRSTDKGPLPLRSTDKGPLALPSTDKGPLPLRSTDKGPLPLRSTDKGPLPLRSTGKGPFPSEALARVRFPSEVLIWVRLPSQALIALSIPPPVSTLLFPGERPCPHWWACAGRRCPLAAHGLGPGVWGH